MIGLDSYSRQVFTYLDPILIYMKVVTASEDSLLPNSAL